MKNRINLEIRNYKIQFINEKGENLGIWNTDKAQEYVDSLGLDLVEISQEGKFSVCKAMDYSKFKYNMSKQTRQKSKKTLDLKIINLRPNIAGADLSRKAEELSKFIEKGHIVNISLKMKGKENAYVDIARKTMLEMLTLSNVSFNEKDIKHENRNLFIQIQPKGNK